MERFKSSDISVLIPTYNSDITIAALLESIFSQNPLPGEVIVVDDASTDDTVSIVKKYPVRLIVQEKNGGVARARNRSIYESAGKVILFLDSDTLLLPCVIRAVIDGFNKNENIHAMNGHCHYRPLNKGWCPLYKGLVENSWSENIKNFDDSSRCINARIGAFTKSSLLEMGGFDENYIRASVEDHEFGIRYTHKYKIYLNKNLIVRHYFPGFLETVKNYWTRTYEIMDLIKKYKSVLDSGGVSTKSAIQYFWGFMLLLLLPIVSIRPFFGLLWAFLFIFYLFTIKKILNKFFMQGFFFGLFSIVLHAIYGTVIVSAVLYYHCRMIRKKTT